MCLLASDYAALGASTDLHKLAYNEQKDCPGGRCQEQVTVLNKASSKNAALHVNMPLHPEPFCSPGSVREMGFHTLMLVCASLCETSC